MAYKWVGIVDEIVIDDKKVGEVQRNGGLYEDDWVPCNQCEEIGNCPESQRVDGCTSGVRKDCRFGCPYYDWSVGTCEGECNESK